jgi:hypothetical protein
VPLRGIACPDLTPGAFLRYGVPMRGKRRRANVNWQAADRLAMLLADRGWTPRDVERESARPNVGHPLRRASMRSVYRVISEGHVPTAPIQFEIAATLELLPSHIWGEVPIPVGHGRERVAA